MFIPYKKIHRIGKSEVDGILYREVFIQEKIDGANTSIRTEDGKIFMGSRTQIIYDGEIKKPFRGFQEYVLQNKGIQKLLNDFPNYRFFGERLVRHTIVYPPEYYNKFYLFDIMYEDKFLDPEYVLQLAKEYEIDTPKLFGIGTYTYEQVMEFVGLAIRGVPGEGVVIKSLDFVNKYGEMCYAKIIHEQFKEENSIVFGNHQKNDIEMKFIVEYITPNRIKKIINKIEQNEGRNIIIQDTPRVLSTVLYDAFTEEMWGYSGNKIIDMGRLRSLSNKRCKFIFHKYLETGEFIQGFDAIV